MTAPRIFPLEAAENDPRFSFGLIADVAAAMEQHGYPALAEYTPLDITELHLALFRFLYCGGDR
ncbi:hypothetical protein [Salinifilum ghardaiensis]